MISNRDTLLKTASNRWGDTRKVSPQNHKSLCTLLQVMQHIELVKEIDFLSMAFNALHPNIKVMAHRQKEQYLDIVLKCIVYRVQNHSWEGFDRCKTISFETLCQLGEELKAEFPEAILRVWARVSTYFMSDTSRLRTLIGLIEESVTQNSSLVSKLSKIIIDYFKGDFVHEDHCDELLSIMESNPTSRREAITCLTKNEKRFSVKTLLRLAKQEHIRDGPSTGSGEVFRKGVFKLIIAALTRKHDAWYKDYADSVAKGREWSYIKFFWQEYAKNGTAKVAEGREFQMFTDNLIDLCDVDAMLSFIEVTQTCKVMCDKVKEIVGTNLGQKYSVYFDLRLKKCKRGEYSIVCNEMITARKHLWEYAPNGEKVFKEMLDNIRRDHSRKTKLQELIRKYFSLLL